MGDSSTVIIGQGTTVAAFILEEIVSMYGTDLKKKKKKVMLDIHGT
jgi:hypothetical protein